MPIVGMTAPFRAPASASFPDVQLLGETFDAGTFLPIQTQVVFIFRNDGTIARDTNPGSPTNTNPWWIPAPVGSIGDTFEISYTGDAADVPFSSPLVPGVWYPLTSDRTIGGEIPDAVTPLDMTFVVSIRDAATQTVQATGTYRVQGSEGP